MSETWYEFPGVEDDYQGREIIDAQAEAIRRGESPEITTPLIEAASRSAWELCGKPYYRVWPHVVRSFLKAPFAGVTADMLRFPFDGFELRFRSDGSPVLGGQAVRAVLVAGVRWDSDSPAARACREHRLSYAGTITVSLTAHSDSGSWGIFTFSKRLTASDDIEEQLISPPELAPTGAAAFVRLIVSCSFAATGAADRLISPHILARDMDRWRQAGDDETRASLAARAHSRRGRKGYEIGRTTGERVLVKPEASEGGGEPTGRHVHGSFVRCGHWHTVCVGKGRVNRKVQWFDQTVVRPDLAPLVISRRNRQRTLAT